MNDGTVKKIVIIAISVIYLLGIGAIIFLVFGDGMIREEQAVAANESVQDTLEPNAENVSSRSDGMAVATGDNVEKKIKIVEAYVQIGEYEKAYELASDLLDGSDSTEAIRAKYKELFEAIVIPAPVISPLRDEHSNNVTVDVETIEGTEVFYSLDSTSPTAISIRYTEPIILEPSEEVRLIALDDYGCKSNVVTYMNDSPVDTAEETAAALPEVSELAFTITTSSTLKENVGGQARIYTGSNLFDDNNATIWVEGDKGNGAGSWIEFTADGPFNLESLSITNGFIKSRDAYYKNNRFTKATIIGTNGEEVKIAAEDGVLNLVDYAVPMEGIEGFRIVFDDIKLGTKYNDLCISELRINGQIPLKYDAVDHIID